MPTECIVTLDAGTGSGRCVIFGRDGQVLASAQELFVYEPFNDPLIPMLRGFDLDAPRFWTSLCGSVRTALAALPADAVIGGVIATSQREACVFLDAAGAVLYAGPNLDARAAMEGMELQQLIDPARLHALTGHAPPYIFPIARWLWFRKHRDGGRIARLLMLNDWITWLLSGECVAEHSNAAESMFYDVATRTWSDELIAAVELPPSVLAPLCWAGARVGSVTAAAAAATGLPAGTPVFAGGADTESALLGAGCHQPGMVGVVLGTTAPVQLVTDRPILDPGGALWTSSHVVPGQWVLESNAGDTGGTHRWLMDLLYGGATTAGFASAEADVLATGAGARAVLAFLGPQVFSLENMNPFRPAGLLFRFPILHIDRPNRGELMRGFFENVAFAVRGNAEQVLRVSGGAAGAVHLGGGMTQSRALVALIADALAQPVAVSSVMETASLGSAMLAAVALGWADDLATAVGTMGRHRVVDPDPGRFGELDARYAQWRDGFAAIGGLSV